MTRVEPAPILQRLARHVRQRRKGLALTMRELAQKASVSQRFLVSLEAGKANISVVRLDDVARALGTTAADLLGDHLRPSKMLSGGLVSLLGLRGAGKTAVGKRAAARLDVPFVELDGLIAERAGMSLEALFAMHGADYYRRLEERELEQLLAKPQIGILATGGSIVTNHATYARLRDGSTTVWLKATTEDHWNRVVAQGDVRPMADRSDAMAELGAILRARRALYERAEHIVDTSSLGLERAVDAIVRIARETLDG